jgi:molecular chaperone DnaK
VSKEDRSAIEQAAAELRAAVESRDIGLMKAKTETLKKAAYRLAEEVYRARSENRGPSGSSGNGASGARQKQKGGARAQRSANETAEEADYEVVDDEKQKT